MRSKRAKPSRFARSSGTRASSCPRWDWVRVTPSGRPVPEGKVLVFELLDRPTASRCYAWEVDGEVTAVLHEGPVDSPQKAVLASILADEPDG